MADYFANPPSLPYLVDPRFTLRAVGRWRAGGLLEFHFDGKLMESLSLPPGEWDVAAMLIDAGMRSSWNWASAFMTAIELARGLYGHSGRGNADPANIPRFVYRLRRSIAKCLANGRHVERIPDPKQWSRRLVELGRFLGYRISLPPENMDLVILGESDSPDRRGQ